MKAIGLYNYLPIHDPESLVDLERKKPTPTGHDVLVNVKAISVNPVDVKVRAPNDLAAYCTPCAWLACLLIFANVLLGSMLIGWRKDRDPMIIGPIHGDQTSASPIHERLSGYAVGFGSFVGSQQTAFA